jgi:hypothetical protein
MDKFLMNHVLPLQHDWESGTRIEGVGHLLSGVVLEINISIDANM